jgi:hypothetical protein
VAVKVQRCRDRGMAKTLLSHLRMHPGQQQGRSIAVAQVWNRTAGTSFTRRTSRVNPCVRLRGRSGSPSARAHTNVSPDCLTPSLRRSTACFTFSRRSSSTAKRGSATALPYRSSVPWHGVPCLGLFEALDHANRPAVQVNVLPTQLRGAFRAGGPSRTIVVSRAGRTGGSCGRHAREGPRASSANRYTRTQM